MEQFYSYIPYGIRGTVADEYLHRILCSRKRIVVVQRPTQIREIERKRINIKRENE